MSDRELLLSLGFREHSRKRVGCRTRVWWYDPEEGAAVPQGWLAARERLRRKAERARAKGAGRGGEPWPT